MISTLTPCNPEPDKRVRLLICFTFPHFLNDRLWWMAHLSSLTITHFSLISEKVENP